jgi:hypothetical protein
MNTLTKSEIRIENPLTSEKPLYSYHVAKIGKITLNYGRSFNESYSFSFPTKSTQSKEVSHGTQINHIHPDDNIAGGGADL